ncbi:MAG: hypothetical protein CMM52_16655 [Rhodospirillaceae bacterium]|nr:hypothetical protein [Rhodospirillaceae bacterium]|tara:strand:- start:66604 stop:67929 length:1326 start_codon:yes stop_codon:yes gene_type:complete
MQGLTSLPLNQILLATLWAFAVIQIFWSHPILELAGGIALGLYIVLVISKIRRRMQILISCLAATAITLAAIFDGWTALWQGMENSVIFAAFFGTVVLLRATADQRPEISRARQFVERLGAQERDSGLMAGSQFLGSVLNVGVMSIFAPIVGRDTSSDIRKLAAEACQRGMCLCCLWSPFWIAMALCYEHLPTVMLWQIMTLGLVFVLVGFVTAHFLYTRSVGLAGLMRAVAALIPVLPPVAAAAFVVLLLNSTTSLSTLQCLVTGIPVLCLFGLAAQGLSHLKIAVQQSGNGIGAVHSEVVLLTAAILLGKTLTLAISETGFNQAVAALGLPDWGVITAVIATITVLAFAGVHQIVTATLVLVLFGSIDTGVSHLIIMEAALIGWAFSSMTGLSAVSVAVASNMFNVSLEGLAYGPNLRFVAVFGVIAVIGLTALNRLLI